MAIDTILSSTIGTLVSAKIDKKQTKATEIISSS